MSEQERQTPPILKSWRNVYALVILVEVAVIAFLYFFTQYFK